MLIVQIGLSDFPDKNDQRLPPSVLKMVYIPTQFKSEEEAKAIQDLGENMQTTTTSFASANFLVSFILSASLSQLWSIINNQ